MKLVYGTIWEVNGVRVIAETFEDAVEVGRAALTERADEDPPPGYVPGTWEPIINEVRRVGYPGGFVYIPV